MKCECRLLHDEGFGVRVVALHTAESRQPEKRLFVEPVVSRLRRVMLVQHARLLLRNPWLEGVEEGRARSVGLPLDDLVTEHEVIAKLRRYQLGDEPMVLVRITTVRTKDQFWI